jgi:hypothetical protein
MRSSSFVFGGILSVAYAMPILPLDHSNKLQMKRQPEINSGPIVSRDPAVDVDLGGISLRRNAKGGPVLVRDPAVDVDLGGISLKRDTITGWH